jgi:MFS family permease
MLSLLRRNVAFRNLVFGQFISLTGDWFNIIALVILLGESNKGVLYVALAMVLKQVSVFLLTPVAGVFADRFDRKKMMFFSVLLRALSVLGILMNIQNESAVLAMDYSG